MTPGVTSQVVYRGTSASGPFTAIATINDNTTATFEDTTVMGGTQYFYEVDAVKGMNSSGPSNQVNATPPMNPVPPTALAVAGTS